MPSVDQCAHWRAPLVDEDHSRPYPALIKQACQIYRRRDLQADTEDALEFRVKNSQEVRMDLPGMKPYLGYRPPDLMMRSRLFTFWKYV